MFGLLLFQQLVTLLRYILVENYLLLHHSGPPCPKGMISLLGNCYGIVRNTQGSNATNQNCFWKSGDQNYQLATPNDDQVGALKLVNQSTFQFTTT